MIGKQILHYKILEKLGEGGMGIVYLAEDTKLKRQVAIKFLPHHITTNEVECKRFEIEAQAAASLNHPNISTIHATEETDSEVFIVMEFIDGIELKDKIKLGPISTEETINIAIQIAKGLEAAHKKGIIHRDIKSQNVMIAEEGKVKVTDFGLAKIQGETGITKNDSTPGTVSYMSPEQSTSEPVDHRSDIWSFGVLLYEMITGELPFKGKHEAGILYSIVHSEPPKIQHVDCPEGLTFIVQKALVKNPDKRYQNMSEVLNDLKTIESGNVLSKPHIKKTSHKVVIFATALIAGCTIALVIFFLNSKPDSKLPPMRTVRLTSYPGMEYDPSLSPDGKKVAFSWNGQEQDNFDIYVKRINGSNPVKLTTNTLTESMPEWSRDGNYIAFIREGKNQPNVPSREIYIIPALGGREKKIVDFNPGWGTVWPSLSWAHDNKFIYYPNWSAKDNGLVIFKVSIETSEIEQVTTLAEGVWGDQSPEVSPDGKYVAFVRGQPDKHDIFVKNFDDNKIQRITHINTLIDGFSWGEDSHSILFASNLDGTSALWKAGFSGDELKKVASGININNPNLSVQSNRLVYAETTESSNIWKIDLRNPDRETLLIGSSNFNSHPDISPDGKKILFSSDRTGTYNIWMCDINGENQSQLTFFESKTTEIVAKWSPSGSEILVQLEDGLFIMNASEGTPVKVSDSIFIVIWNKDGSGFYGRQYSQNNIYSIARDGKVQQQITHEGGLIPYLFEDYIYYIKNWTYRDIWRIPVNGGAEEPVLQGVSNLDMASWTVVKNGIYFIHNNNSGARVLEFYNFSTNKISNIKDVPRARYFSKIEVTPDENYLLYSRKESIKSDIILVDNFTP